MPESVNDRPTKAHEQIFLLAKRLRYFYDAEAIAEPAIHAGRVVAYDGSQKNCAAGDETNDRRTLIRRTIEVGGSRNRRSVWTIPSESFSGAHFATFPQKLVEPCILAGTSAKGCCPKCRTPWIRILSKERVATRPGTNGKATGASIHPDSPYHDQHGLICGNRDPLRHCAVSQTTGWRPGCKCENVGDPVPCLVLDPFAGTATVGRVAVTHGRDFVGVELNTKYVEMGQRRSHGITPPLFTETGAGTES